MKKSVVKPWLIAKLSARHATSSKNNVYVLMIGYFSFGRRDLSHEQFTRRDQHNLRGQVAGTKFWSLRLDFLVKMGSSHEGTKFTWSQGLVPPCVPTLREHAPDRGRLGREQSS